ncbi:MAG: putative rane protein [Nocardia sp.]|uniref:hypothetical protein n=1 Tax=Nocardia sp. TaxID=1821 RepID=UPI002624B3F4|nr:hypothetical protein [Nocardia sp.]MCU1647638.1 putative rane protein [Nocardia sp.]
MISKQNFGRYGREIGSAAVDLLPPAIVAAAAIAAVLVLGAQVWTEAGCGLVIVATLGFALWNRVEHRQRRSRRLLFAAAPAIVALAVLVSLQMLVQRPADHDLASARTTVAQTASDGATSILSYKPETVDQDLAAAKTRLTGDFLDTYGKLADTVVGPTAKEKRVTMQATPTGSAVESVSRDQATVIVYIDQITTVAGNPSPSQSQNALRVGLAKVDGRWLINRFEPLF